MRKMAVQGGRVLSEDYWYSGLLGGGLSGGWGSCVLGGGRVLDGGRVLGGRRLLVQWSISLVKVER